MRTTPIIILGGRSIVAPYLMDRLASRSHEVSVASRRDLSLPYGMLPLKLDLEAAGGWTAPDDAVVISLLPVWVLAEHLELFEKARALVAVSSTSRFGKAGSDDPKELETVALLAQGEAKLEYWARENGKIFTILRPTLIYDGRNDVNVTRIAGMIRRFGTVPIAAPGKGLRRPIHADDVAGAIMGAIDNPGAAGKAFNIAGSEVLTYRSMVERVFTAMGRRPRPLMLPGWALKAAFRLLSRVGLLKAEHFGFAVFQRMNEDLIFDVREGLEILRYQPRGFQPDIQN